MRTSEMKQWLVDEIGFVPVDDEDGIKFYYTAMHDYNMGLCDADDYGWLNTLLRYDVGAERALAIIDWFYVNEDVTVQDAIDVNSVRTLMDVCKELGLEIDFSHWVKEEPKYFEYGFKADEFTEVE